MNRTCRIAVQAKRYCIPLRFRIMPSICLCLLLVMIPIGTYRSRSKQRTFCVTSIYFCSLPGTVPRHIGILIFEFRPWASSELQNYDSDRSGNRPRQRTEIYWCDTKWSLLATIPVSRGTVPSHEQKHIDVIQNKSHWKHNSILSCWLDMHR